MIHWLRHWHKRHHHSRKVYVWLVTKDFAILLDPERTTLMASTLHIDQIDTQSIVAVDASGSVVTPVTFETFGDASKAICASRA